MSARSKSRKRALDILFESEQRSVPALDTLSARLDVGVANAERIDELLTTYSQDWSLDRMPAVDRAILRLATFELLWRDDVPDAVVIDEAVTLARSLSTDDSPGFVNGLLGRLLDLKPMLAPAPADASEPGP